MTRRLALAVCLLGSAALCCCSGGGGGASHADPALAAERKALKVTPDKVAKYQDPVVASQLHERAFDMLSAMARGTDPQLRANALESLARMPQRLEPLVIPALHDENPGVRSTAAQMVGRVRLKDTAPAVRPLLDDPSPFVRASAIYALVRCGMQVDQSPLAALLMNDPSARVRAHVAYLLGEIGEPSASGLLRDAARMAPDSAQSSELRILQMQIAEALVKLGDPTQIEPIRAALYPSRPEDLEITALAAQIIGLVRDGSSVDELIYLTAYRDRQGHMMPAEIRLAAAASLAKLGLDKGAFVADEYAGNQLAVLRAQSAYVYGEVGHPANLPKLEVLISDPSGIVQVAAAGAVLKIRPPTAAGATAAK